MGMSQIALVGWNKRGLCTSRDSQALRIHLLEFPCWISWYTHCAATLAVLVLSCRAWRAASAAALCGFADPTAVFGTEIGAVIVVFLSFLGCLFLKGAQHPTSTFIRAPWS
jgi:hypothetical protein